MSLYPLLAATPPARPAEVAPVMAAPPLVVAVTLMQNSRVNGVLEILADMGS